LNFIKRQVLQKRKKKKGYCILLYLVTDHTTDSWLKVFITMYVYTNKHIWIIKSKKQT